MHFLGTPWLDIIETCFELICILLVDLIEVIQMHSHLDILIRHVSKCHLSSYAFFKWTNLKYLNQIRYPHLVHVDCLNWSNLVSHVHSTWDILAGHWEIFRENAYNELKNCPSTFYSYPFLLPFGHHRLLRNAYEYLLCRPSPNICLLELDIWERSLKFHFGPRISVYPMGMQNLCLKLILACIS